MDNFSNQKTSTVVKNNSFSDKDLIISAPYTRIYIYEDNWSIGGFSGTGTITDPFLIEDLEIDGQNQYDCIVVEKSTAYFRIENCSLSNIGALNAGKAGIKLINASNGVITNNSYSTHFGGNYGIYLYNNSDYNVISDNTIGNFTYGIYVQSWCDNNSFDGNYIFNCSNSGIYLWGREGSIDRRNYNNNITNNILCFNGNRGLGMSRTHENFISGNIAYNTTYGFDLSGATDSVISKNIAFNCTYGFSLYVPSYTLIIENIAYKNDYGFMFSGATDLCNTSRNLVYNNIIQGFNVLYMFGSSGNYFLENLFIDNMLQAIDSSTVNNNWNNSRIGNYWSNYTGVDSDKNGIGDSQHVITGLKIDHKPIFGDPRHNGSAIAIDGTGANGVTWAFASTRFWCIGAGSKSDPYKIKDLVINAQNKSAGIKVRSSSLYYLIENCSVYNSSAKNTADYYAVSLYLAHNGTIKDCSISFNGKYGPNAAHGIYIFNSDNCTVINNNIFNNSGSGIYTVSSDNLTIIDNHVFNNTGYGFYSSTCKYLNFSLNLIERNKDDGSYLISLTNSTFASNKILRNGIDEDNDHGLLIWTCNSNTFKGNNITGNAGNGIRLWNLNRWNWFYLNFIGKNRDASNNAFEYDNNVNYWNNSIIGNQWYGYNSPDANDDGIGDVAYNIPQGNGPGVDWKPIRNDGFNGSKIIINDRAWNNWNWARTRIWCTGSGTEQDPYIIQDLTINCGGAGSGILINNSRAHFRIENCTIFNSPWIAIPNSNGAVKLQNTTNGLIINCNLSNNLGIGIYLFNDCDYNRIENNLMIDNQYGVYILYRSDNNYIANNLINSSTFHGIYIATTSTYTTPCNNSFIYNNTITHNGQSGIVFYTNKHANDTTILQNIIKKNNYGINLGGVDSSIWYQNLLISENIINENVNYGIWLNFVQGAIISLNDIKNTSNGASYGIYINNFVKYSNFTQNNISQNVGTGIYIDSSSNQDNNIYNNTFISNGNNARDDDINNKWDNEIIGNFWDDYDGYDLDGNGIGETWYNLPGTYFPNDTLPICFRADTIAPIITINTPLSNALFASQPPSFELEIDEYAMNMTWYSIYNGISWSNNYTFTGVLIGTINQNIWNTANNGTATIRFYANDTINNFAYSDVIVRKDIIAPTIEIDFPMINSYYNETLPKYNLTILEANLNKTWYTLNGGGTNTSFTGNGTIATGIWTPLLDGQYVWRFYANDTMNNKQFAELTITKDTISPIINIEKPLSTSLLVDPPIYEVTITEINPYTSWYTLNNSAPVYFTGFTGEISPTLWEGFVSDNDIALTIRFYIRDAAGNTGYDEVTVKKMPSDSGKGDDTPSDNSKSSTESPQFDMTIILIIIGSVAVIAFVGIVYARKSRKQLKKSQTELKTLKAEREQITENDITISKEKHLCLVHKGPIEGYSYICPKCGAYYCAKCIEVLKKAENECWSCGTSLDPSMAKKSVAKKAMDEKIAKDKEIQIAIEEADLKHKAPKKGHVLSESQELSKDQKPEAPSVPIKKENLIIKAPLTKAEQEKSKIEPQKVVKLEKKESAVKPQELSEKEANIKKFTEYIEKMTMMDKVLDEKFKKREIPQEEYIQKKTVIAEKMGEATAKLEQLKE